MKRAVIFYLVGRILLIEAILLLLPAIVGLIYRESWTYMSSYLLVSAILFLISHLSHMRWPKRVDVHAMDGIIVVALLWILISFFGALPLVISGEIPNIFDAFFEISSGFTTTGSSIIEDLEPLQKSTLFWRSFTHFVGGMGVLVFTLAVLPTNTNYVNLMRAEVPGPVFGKLTPKISDSARILYQLYSVMTLILIGILVAMKVPVFDAMLLAFGTAGTGGFAINNGGFEIYQHTAIVEWTIAIGMFLFGVNFNLYYYILKGYLKDVVKSDEELKYYVGIALGATLLIAMNIAPSYQSLEATLRESFFTVSSLMTTTGYAVNNFDRWPLFSHTILLGLMFIGGMAGSTAGGMKVSRIVIYMKSAISELRKAAQPRRMLVTNFSNKPITEGVLKNVANYLLIYVIVFVVILLSVSLEVGTFETAFSSVAATFNNIGPGLSEVGPTKNFAFYSNWNKFVLSLAMIAGRLEIIPIVILFSPRTLRHLFKGY